MIDWHGGVGIRTCHLSAFKSDLSFFSISSRQTFVPPCLACALQEAIPLICFATIAGKVLDGNNVTARCVLLFKLPRNWRTGPAWALRNLRLRRSDASTSLLVEFFRSRRLLHQGENGAAGGEPGGWRSGFAFV